MLAFLRRLFAAPAPAVCAGCAELRARLAAARERETYWREREERATDALLDAKGSLPVARKPVQLNDPMRDIMTAMGITSIDSRKQSSQPGPEAMTRGDAH